MLGGAGVADLPLVGQDGPQQVQPCISLAPLEQEDAVVPATLAFSLAVGDRLKEHQRLLKGGTGARVLPQKRLGAGEVDQRVAFAAPVAGLLADSDGLLARIDRARGLSKLHPGVAYVAQRNAFTLPFAQLAGDRKALLETLNTATRCSEMKVLIVYTTCIRR